MKLLLIRHGEPDYDIDSLTEKGWKEAELLSEKLCNMKIDEFYVSPLGRAKDTAKATLEKLNKKAEVKEWLQEFPCRIDRPDRSDKKMIAWDWLPQDWTTKENFYDKNNWSASEILKAGNVDEEYRRVIQEFDIFLSEHGYEREGNYYKVTKPNNDTIAFFCHFGLGCVLLSHLLGISPMVLWHGFCAAPTSVTTVVTEERREGIASFRMSSYGDISHLYAKNEEPSFAARFCECYKNSDERHD